MIIIKTKFPLLLFLILEKDINYINHRSALFVQTRSFTLFWELFKVLFEKYPNTTIFIFIYINLSKKIYTV
ncbi:hypothetical protein CR195_001685 [Bacillus cereus]|nr:hypothetical protein AT280_11395 [Bacillus cereus]PYD99680.1 hypothetical protein CR195_001685 [Bacillus cereus]